MFPDETDRLNSWKAIAAYLERDVRTVQLWEKEQALPVHRQRHAKLSSVFAYKSELDRWRLDRTQGPKHSTVRQKPLNDDTAPLVLAHGNVAVPPTSQTAAASAADLPSSGLGERRWPVLYKWTGVTLVIVLAGAVASGIVHWNHQPGLLLPGPHTVPVTTRLCSSRTGTEKSEFVASAAWSLQHLCEASGSRNRAAPHEEC
jgi:hypothetical protein